MKYLRPTRLLLAAFVAIALTGCVKLDMDLTVSADDTVDGTVVVAVSDQLLSFIPGGEEELLDDITDDLDDFDDMGSATVERYRDDRFVGASVTFQDVPLDKVSTPGSDFAITHDGERYRVTGTLDLSAGGLAGDLGDGDLPPGLDPQEFFSAAEIRIAITLPKPVEESNGTIDGCTVVWTPTFGESIELNAVTSPSGDCSGAAGSSASGLDWWAWLLIGLAGLVLVAAAVVAVIIGERRKRRPPERI